MCFESSWDNYNFSIQNKYETFIIYSNKAKLKWTTNGTVLFDEALIDDRWLGLEMELKKISLTSEAYSYLDFML